MELTLGCFVIIFRVYAGLWEGGEDWDGDEVLSDRAAKRKKKRKKKEGRV